MSDLPQERSLISSSVTVAESWPERGNVVLENVCLRYRPNLPLALNGLSFQIPAGTKCGVVGRTG
jgi:ATP-binding cassette, subfamily C (CFTR/MRP), member 1